VKLILLAAPVLLFTALASAQTPTPTPQPSASPSPSATPTATPTPTPVPPTAREIINVLSDSQLQQAIQSLRANFLDAARTDDRELRRATLEGLIDRLAPGIAVTTEAAVKQSRASFPFLAEILDGRIGYLRLGMLNKEALAQMDAALANFNAKGLKAVILDLRGEPASENYEAAAEVAKRFCPKGRLLFSIQKPSAKQERILISDRDPAFSGILVVLTDRENAGGTEALAATLRKNANAMIVGAATRGETVEFSDVPLGDGKILRVAVAQVALADSGPIFPAGVKPDIAAALAAADQARIFSLSKDRGVSSFVFESERPHLNEASLVSNTNPEIDPAVLRQSGNGVLWDTVLQRAVDLVTAISFYNDHGK